jgi:hypothetical protein
MGSPGLFCSAPKSYTIAAFRDAVSNASAYVCPEDSTKPGPAQKEGSHLPSFQTRSWASRGALSLLLSLDGLLRRLLEHSYRVSPFETPGVQPFPAFLQCSHRLQSDPKLTARS